MHSKISISKENNSIFRFKKIGVASDGWMIIRPKIEPNVFQLFLRLISNILKC